jgi:hypothetical protein
MGLAGESGELLDLVKKINFKPNYPRDDNDLIEELGDVYHTRRTITVESRQAHGEGRKRDGIQ